jgi:hypothetical protein
VESSDADQLQTTNVQAQELALQRKLYPDWRQG